MRKLRWGVVGAGDIVTKRVAPALRDSVGSELRAVSRRRPQLAESFAREMGIPRVHARWEELVRDPEVDAVYIATPVAMHAPVAVAAAHEGKHVLCEKPMALGLEECDRMIDAADRAGVRLGVAYYRHLYPIVRRAKELVAGGAVGKVAVAQANAFEYFDPPADHSRAWLLDPAASGGGPMFDFGCHRIEVLLHLLGEAQEAVGRVTNSHFSRSVEDTGVAVIRFDGGALATVTVSHAAAEPHDTLHLFGSEGSIHIPRLNGDELRLVREGKETVESHPAPSNLHQPLIEQFVRSAHGEEEPVVDGRTGREVNRLLREIYA